MAKQKKQKSLNLDWDTAPNGDGSGFSEIRLGALCYYLNFQRLQFDPAGRILWWIDHARVPSAGANEVYEKVVMDFAPDVQAAKRAAEATFTRLLRAPQLEVVY